MFFTSGYFAAKVIIFTKESSVKELLSVKCRNIAAAKSHNTMKRIFFFVLLTLCLSPFHRTMAQITGKFGTYYDQRELLFEAMPTSENDIIFLGNSITDGGEWAEIFQNINCKNRGISGDKCPGVLNRLATITKGQPAMVFLMIGVNDMGAGVASDTIAKNIRTIVQRLKSESPRTAVYLQSVLPTSDCFGMFNGHTSRWQQVAEINELLKVVATEEEVTYIDLYAHFATEEGKMNPQYSNDGLHINGEGYKLWRQVIEDQIGKLP